MMLFTRRDIVLNSRAINVLDHLEDIGSAIDMMVKVQLTMKKIGGCSMVLFCFCGVNNRISEHYQAFGVAALYAFLMHEFIAVLKTQLEARKLSYQDEFNEMIEIT